MIYSIREQEPIARKEHNCDACFLLFDCLSREDLCELCTFTELRAIIVAKRDGCKILPGNKYIRQFNTDGADTWTYKARPEIHEINMRLDLHYET